MTMLDKQLLIFAGMTGRLILTLTLVLLSAITQAATYGVSPLSITFSATQKSSVVTVVNEDTRPVMLRVKAMAWTQDGSGSDTYVDTTDLVFFPKRLELAPGDKRVIRVGINSLQGPAEKAYRLYVEELPPAVLAEDDSTKLSVLVTFGLPVFVQPDKAEPDLKLEAVTVKDDVIVLSINNAGSRHARLSRVLLHDGSVVSDAIEGRYIFPGIRKQVSVTVPAAFCSGKKESLAIETENGELAVDVIMPTACGS
jgi:fimbrial chaperone protein